MNRGWGREGLEEGHKGFKGAEGNIEGDEGGRVSGSNGKGEVSGEPVWGDLQFPKEALKFHINLSKIMPTRKEANGVGAAYTQQGFKKGVVCSLRSSHVL